MVIDFCYDQSVSYASLSTKLQEIGAAAFLPYMGFASEIRRTDVL
jgi:hypothetical protein